MTTPNAIPGIDFSHYDAPGIYMNPGPGPQIAVNGSQPNGVGIFGQAIGYRTFTETVQIPQDVAGVPQNTRTLSKAGINVSTIQVIGLASAGGSSSVTGITYTVNTDYVVNTISGTAGSSTATYAIAMAASGSSLTELENVQVSYQYTDANYFSPQVFYDYDDVRTYYGDPWNTTSNAVQSELTLAAQFAFNNGAYAVVSAAVQPTGKPATGSTVPTAQDSDYINALGQLQDQPLVAVVVPATGSRINLYGSNGPVSQHVNLQSASEYERRAIVGLDGSVTGVPSSSRITDAQALNNERVMMVSPATYTYYAQEINQTVTVGGQYIAASLAGMTCAMSFAQPLTRKLLTGWQSVAETQLTGQKNAEAQAGLAVIEQTRTGQIQVRHGVTTNPSSLLTREWSIIGQQDALAYRLRDYLNAANLIGQPIYPYTLANVKGSADAALQSLLRDALIVDYTGLKVRQLITNPDVLEISFQWLPAFPLNYIVVSFAISLTTGSVNSVGSTASQTNVTSQAAPVTSGAITAPAAPQVNDFGGSSNTLQSD